MMTRMDKRIYIAAFFLYLTAVCILCFMKGDNLPDVEKFLFGIPLDKAAHFVMFLPYPILASLSFIHKDHGVGKNVAILTVLTVVGFGLAYGTEVIQAQTGYRAYETGDFIADSAGLFTGALATAAFIIIQNHKK